MASLLLFFGTSHSLTFLFYFFLQLPRAGGEWGVAFPCVFLHFTLPPPLSLIAFLYFKWQGHQERKGRREINSNKKQPSAASQWLWSSKYPSSNLLKWKRNKMFTSFFFVLKTSKNTIPPAKTAVRTWRKQFYFYCLLLAVKVFNFTLTSSSVPKVCQIKVSLVFLFEDFCPNSSPNFTLTQVRILL